MSQIGTLHPITIKVAEDTYIAAKIRAENLGYLSIEEYMSDWLENDPTFEIPMTPALALALEKGLADCREGRVVSLEEHDRRHAERRAAWIQANQT